MTAPSDAPVRERVARAMCKAERPPIDPDKSEISMVPVWEARDVTPRSAEFWRISEWHKRVGQADAAIAEVIAAMREPSEEMIRMGVVGDPLGCDVDEADIPMIYTRIWQFMLSQFAEESRSLSPEDGRRG